MFGLFTRKDKDVVVEATLKANRETREDVAVDRFLETLGRDNRVVADLRETYRNTIDELCDKCGISDVEARRSIHRQMWTAFPQNLRLTVREYLRDHRALTAMAA